MKRQSKSAVRKKLVKELDRVFSLYIRSRDQKKYGKCPLCARAPIENCFHFITRAKYSVRWDPANAIGSCYSCNLKNEFNPHPYIQWYIKNMGVDAYDALIAKSNTISKLSSDDLQTKIDIVEKMRGII